MIMIGHNSGFSLIMVLACRHGIFVLPHLMAAQALAEDLDLKAGFDVAWLPTEATSERA